MDKIHIEKHFLGDDGTFPNNYALPLLIYKNALTLEKSEDQNASSIEKLFRKNDWKNSWRDGIYEYHHYHSTAHEVMGVYEGDARVQFGGAKGPVIEISKGDVVIVPAGVAHKKISSTTNFKCVGAYPSGQDYDMQHGHIDERPETDQKISSTPLPNSDPVFGKEGPLEKWWSVRLQNQ